VASFKHASCNFCNNCWNSTGTSVTISDFQATIQIRSLQTLPSEVTDVIAQTVADITTRLATDVTTRIVTVVIAQTVPDVTTRLATDVTTQ